MDEHIEATFADFRETILVDNVVLQRSLLESTIHTLAQAMRPHILEIVERDGLPHLAHAIVGWGDALFGGTRLTDRIAAFVTKGPMGFHIPQCDPEGDFHPWQSFAYAAMAGADGERSLDCSPHSLISLARSSRHLQTRDGRELGHLLFALAEFDPDPDGPPLFMDGEKVSIRRLPERAIHAHHFGTFEVCRKFHLTEGLCAAVSRIPSFERYHSEAQGFLDGQMTVLELFAFLMNHIRQARGGATTTTIELLRQVLRIGPNLENHLFYAGHLIELASLARLDGFHLSNSQMAAVNFVLNEINHTLGDWLPHLSFTDCFLSLGHFRRAASLWSVIDVLPPGRSFLQRNLLLRAYACDFDADPWHGLAPTPKQAPANAIYDVAWSSPNLRQEFAAVVDAYIRTTPPPGLLPRGRFDHFRRIGPAHWPRSLHYELLDHGTGVGVELHLESDDLESLKPIVRDFASTIGPKFPNARVVWDDRWYKGRGRLVVFFPNAIPSSAVAASARSLIDLTYYDVDRAVQLVGLTVRKS
ncbi:hypothetical protein GOL29_27990 [Sinorhizobium medicae]|nr:hypothetical protein [Sinorhizobium medicae]